jgi:exodeoxyribonuclease VII small subunit
MTEPPPDNLTFEESLAELDRLVREMEDGRLGLEQALARYEQGVGLLRRCQQQLAQAEQRILLVTGADGDGRPVLQPFAHEATAAVKAEPPVRRLRKRGDGP